jgi:hypothetical protein
MIVLLGLTCVVYALLSMCKENRFGWPLRGIIWFTVAIIGSCAVIGREVAPEIAYVKFWRVFRETTGQQASPEQVTIRLHHKPGEKTQIDFSEAPSVGLPTVARISFQKFPSYMKPS